VMGRKPRVLTIGPTPFAALQIFHHYEQHRWLMLEEVLNGVARLPSSQKRKLRTYRYALPSQAVRGFVLPKEPMLLDTRCTCLTAHYGLCSQRVGGVWAVHRHPDGVGTACAHAAELSSFAQGCDVYRRLGDGTTRNLRHRSFETPVGCFLRFLPSFC
jgi:hypothetical protein